MTAKHGTLRLKGLCLGQPIAIRHFFRESTADMPKNSVLYWGDQAVTLDIQRMNRRESNALPSAYLIGDDASRWEPFIRECLMAGRLR